MTYDPKLLKIKVMDSFKDLVTKYNSPKNIFAFLIIAVLVIFFVGYGITNLSSTKTSPNDSSQNPSNKSLAPYIIVYGSWSQNASAIYAFDLSSQKEYLIANLPVNVKKITILSPDKFLYLAQTDEYDHAKTLLQYNVVSKALDTIVTAQNGYGIDDYLVSPNRQYGVIWEVSPNPETGILFGGKSRIYSFNLASSTQQNLLYDEIISTAPIHYPRAVMDDGRIFFDTFVSNSSAGWAYGMSVSDFTGVNKQNINSMTNGTYSSQPISSPDGKYLLFSGYDGSKGLGTSDTNGFRRAISFPNTVETLDTSTLTRSKVPNLSNQNIYSGTNWTSNTSILYHTLSKTNGVNGTYLTNLENTEGGSKIKLSRDEIGITKLDTNILIGKASSTLSSNLGSGYSSIYSQLLIQNDETTLLPLSQQLIQFIGVFPSSYFGTNIDVFQDSIVSRSNLHLSGLYFKPELEEKRDTEQNDPPLPTDAPPDNEVPPPDSSTIPTPTTSTGEPESFRVYCRDLAPKYCDEIYGITNLGQRASSPGYFDCVDRSVVMLKNQGLCTQSPLYLYGPEGLSVNVTIHTEVSNSTPQYNNGYKVTLGKQGEFYTNNYSYSKITFDYVSAIPLVRPPNGGVLTAKNNLNATIESIANRLKLNMQETKDLKTSANQLITSPFALISFYDHVTSNAILPITVDPKPDVYRNIVFYFKNLDSKPNFSIDEPRFKPIIRQGFSAIEISEIVE